MWFERTSVVFTFFESRFVIELMSIHSDFPIAFHNTDFFTRVFLIFLFNDFQENFFRIDPTPVPYFTPNFDERNLII